MKSIWIVKYRQANNPSYTQSYYSSYQSAYNFLVKMLKNSLFEKINPTTWIYIDDNLETTIYKIEEKTLNE